MLIAILQFDLLIHGSTSLKDKRRVVSSVKDRLHREHLAAVAEIGSQESHSVARLGLALVGSDEKYLAQTLDRIALKLRALHDAELGDCRRDIIAGREPDEMEPMEIDLPDPLLAQELLRHADSTTPDHKAQ